MKSSSTLSVVASGGGLAAAVAGAVAGGAASGGLGALAARFLGRERAELIETMISEGGWPRPLRPRPIRRGRETG
jgi:hypothetical protein